MRYHIDGQYQSSKYRVSRRSYASLTSYREPFTGPQRGEDTRQLSWCFNASARYLTMVKLCVDCTYRSFNDV